MARISKTEHAEERKLQWRVSETECNTVSNDCSVAPGRTWTIDALNVTSALAGVDSEEA